MCEPYRWAQVVRDSGTAVRTALGIPPLLIDINDVCMNTGDDCAEHELVQALLRENDHAGKYGTGKNARYSHCGWPLCNPINLGSRMYP